MTTDLTLEEIGRRVGMEVHYLCRVFKQFTNMSPGNSVARSCRTAKNPLRGLSESFSVTSQGIYEERLFDYEFQIVRIRRMMPMLNDSCRGIRES